MIIDIICDLYWGYENEKKNWTRSEVMSYVADVVTYIDVKICNRIMRGLFDHNYKEFKEGCLDYMRAYGYEGSIAWKKFKAMPIKAIKAMFNA